MPRKSRRDPKTATTPPRGAANPEGRARQLAGLRRGRQKAVGEAVLEVSPHKPALTIEMARSFVQLLMAGVTAIEALRFLSPEYWQYCTRDQRRNWLVEVQASSFVADETDRHNEGAWQDLESADRLRIALDKHFAEMAYFLFTHNFADPSADRAKMTEAREAIVAKIEQGEGGGGNAFDTFLKALADRTDLTHPPTLAPAPPVHDPIYTEREDH